MAKISNIRRNNFCRSTKRYFKLIEWYEPSLLNGENAYDLFDLKNDVGETTNLSQTNPEKIAELKALLEHWRTNVDAQMPTINKNAASNSGKPEKD
jgi:hypothetical protein